MTIVSDFSARGYVWSNRGAGARLREPMMCSSREKWRLGVNVILAEILAPMLYGISTSLYLPSFHRFVTNPTTAQNKTLVNEAEPGLGQSEMFYSILIGTLYVGQGVGALLSGFFVKCIPHCYQFLSAISLHVVGYVFYGVATSGWVLMVGLFLVGYYLGAQLTLSLNYTMEISIEYVDFLIEKGEMVDRKKKVMSLRNSLYAVYVVGFSIGYAIGPGLSILFSHLPIEQYRPAAWFNVAFGTPLLLLFILFFQEGSNSKCKSRINCSQACCCFRNKEPLSLRPLQIFILVTMLLLCFVTTLRWSLFDTLMNPVLSDSFGFNISVSSYVYLGIAFSNILGSILLFILQQLKITTQWILFIGITITVTGYLLMTDWQTIPYDPCTEYSPFHHPERFQMKSNSTDIDSIPKVLSKFIYLNVDLSVKMEFINGQTVNINPPYRAGYECHKDESCLECDNAHNHQPCLSFVLDKGNGTKLLEKFSCSVSILKNLCINIISYTKDINSKSIKNSDQATAQSFLLLPTDVYATASNACLSANVSCGQCHWIPSSMVEKCADCPPICRGKQRTLLFPLYLLGIILVIGISQIVWVNVVALASNQTPYRIQGIVIGIVTMVNGISSAVGSIIVESLYEGAQKRIFPASILLACLLLPFLIEIVVLNKHLGPTFKL